MGIYVTYEFSCLKQNVLISASDMAHIRASPVRTCMRTLLAMHRHACQPAETLHNSVRNSSMQHSFLWFTIDTIRPKVFNPSQQMGISSSFPLVSEPIPRDTDVSEIQQTLSLLDLFYAKRASRHGKALVSGASACSGFQRSPADRLFLTRLPLQRHPAQGSFGGAAGSRRPHQPHAERS